MMISDIRIVLKLEDKIHIIDLLHTGRLNLSVLIDKVDRYGRVVHLLCETGKMKTHHLIESVHRVVVAGRQGTVIYGDMFSIQKYLLFKDMGLIFYKRGLVSQFQNLCRSLGL